MIKYKCLVLDHDDTVVNSTATIHYPCFVEYLEKFYPRLAKSYTVESYFVKNFHPGITSLLVDEVGLNAEELLHEEAYWSEYVKGHIPTVYEGICEIISDFRAEGGIIAVDSHSYSEYIVRDWKHNDLPDPDIIYGWDIPTNMRKPPSPTGKADDTIWQNQPVSPSLRQAGRMISLKLRILCGKTATIT